MKQESNLHSRLTHYLPRRWPSTIDGFSNGGFGRTGQIGGQHPDRLLSNIYKLFRVTRVGPDSAINPCKQTAFYDAGLGTLPF